MNGSVVKEDNQTEYKSKIVNELYDVKLKDEYWL